MAGLFLETFEQIILRCHLNPDVQIYVFFAIIINTIKKRKIAAKKQHDLDLEEHKRRNNSDRKLRRDRIFVL